MGVSTEPAKTKTAQRVCWANIVLGAACDEDIRHNATFHIHCEYNRDHNAKHHRGEGKLEDGRKFAIYWEVDPQTVQGS